MLTTTGKTSVLLRSEHRLVQLPLSPDGDIRPEVSVLRTQRYVACSGSPKSELLTDTDPYQAGRSQIGLIPAIVTLLVRSGHHVSCADVTDRSLPKRSPGAVAKRGIRDSTWLKYISSDVPTGLLEYRAGDVDPAWLLAQAALEWPTARIVIVASSRSSAEQLRHCLCRFIAPSAVAVADCGNASQAARIMIATPRATLHAGLLFADFVFFLDAVEAVGEHSQDVLRQPMKARTFGFLPMGQPLSPYERDIIAASFGFDPLQIHGHGLRTRRATMLQVAVHGPQVREDATAYSLRRRTIEQHPARNRLVIRIARAMASGDVAALQSLVTTTKWCDGVGGRTVVLAASVDHVLTLAKRMPEWGVIVGDELDSGGLSRLQRLIAGESSDAVWNSRRHVITTTAGLGRIRSLQRVSAVIRADGSAGIPGVLRARAVIGNTSLIVVDFEDRHIHPACRKWTRTRVEQAVELGWDVLRPCGKPYTSVDLFLARRPKGKQ